jgi:O-antigen/teichoic acid export membrane protein
VTRHAAPARYRIAASAIRGSGAARPVVETACYSVGGTMAAGLGGVVLARTLGPAVRGEYAAVTAWLGIALLIGGLGQPAALCYYVAQQPGQARSYVATSRAMMVVTGSVALVAGMLLAPVLAHGDPNLTLGYRIAFCGVIVGFAGSCYTYALQARNFASWNVIRSTQPVLAFASICGLWAVHRLSLDTALIALVGTLIAQCAWAQHRCRREQLAPGRARRHLVRPLATFGIAQMASLAPWTLNTYLDQLLLSQLAPAADLGRYAIAVSITSLPMPVVSAIGYTAFPRLAARSTVSSSDQQLLKMAVILSAAIAAVLLVPGAVAATWLVPLVFGARYAGVVPLLWILTPGGVFIACGQVTGDMLRGRKNLSVVAYSQWIAVIATVAGLCALLPTMGVAGAAVASTVAYGVALAAMVRSLWKTPGPQVSRNDATVPGIA